MTVIPITRKRGGKDSDNGFPVPFKLIQGPPTLLADTPDTGVRTEIVNWLDGLLPTGYVVGEPASPFGELAIINTSLDEAVAWVATPEVPSVAALRLPPIPERITDRHHTPLELLALAEFAASEGLDEFDDRPLPTLTGELEETAFSVLEERCERGAVGYMASLTPRGECIFTTTSAQEMRRLYRASVRVAVKPKTRAGDSPDSAVLALTFSLRHNYQSHLMDDDQVAEELRRATKLWQAWAASSVADSWWS